jgi:hypothetical protein
MKCNPDARDFMHGLIEPGAIDARPDHDGQIRLSIAISLKRIADLADANLGENAFAHSGTLLGILNSIEMDGRR